MWLYLFPAYIQWFYCFWIRNVLILLGLVLVPIAILTEVKPGVTRFGSQSPMRFKKPGRVGNWIFSNVRYRLLWLWGNDEDGFGGDRYGNWWLDRDKEPYTFWSKFNWSAIRNPVNNASRYWRLMSCNVNECLIKYWGDPFTDDNPRIRGWFFIRARKRDSHLTYYGVRYVTKTTVWFIGLKFEPGHFTKVQPLNNRDKGFSMRAKADTTLKTLGCNLLLWLFMSWPIALTYFVV